MIKLVFIIKVIYYQFFLKKKLTKNNYNEERVIKKKMNDQQRSTQTGQENIGEKRYESVRTSTNTQKNAESSGVKRKRDESVHSSLYTQWYNVTKKQRKIDTLYNFYDYEFNSDSIKQAPTMVPSKPNIMMSSLSDITEENKNWVHVNTCMMDDMDKRLLLGKIMMEKMKYKDLNITFHIDPDDVEKIEEYLIDRGFKNIIYTNGLIEIEKGIQKN